MGRIDNARKATDLFGEIPDAPREEAPPRKKEQSDYVPVASRPLPWLRVLVPVSKKTGNSRTIIWIKGKDRDGCVTDIELTVDEMEELIKEYRCQLS